MSWLRRVLLRWLNEGAIVRLKEAHDSILDDDDPPFDVKFAIVRAANGVLLKVTKYRPGGRLSDFEHEIHIVKDGETVMDTIRRALVLTQLEK
jgi:hypothetical protein